MIDRETLERISRFTGLKLFQQEKNYIQTLILRSIYVQVSRELVFKGDTCLAFFHGLNRFSEDLDFTLNKDFDLSLLSEEIRKDMGALNIRAGFRVLEDNPRSFSLRIGAEGPFFTREIERCFVRIEISRREKVAREIESKEIKPPYPDISPFLVPVMAEEEMLAEKIRAILWRRKARDLYDAWFLLKKGVNVDLKLVEEKLSYYGKKFSRQEFWKAVRVLEDSWEREMTPVIAGSLPDFAAVRKEVKVMVG